MTTEHTSTESRQEILMRFLALEANALGVGQHIYVVGGAVRNWVLGVPIKDVDIVVDSVALGDGRDSGWFAAAVQRAIPVQTDVTTNQYGVVILTVKGSWVLCGLDMQGEVIEIANARVESYTGGGSGKGYKPERVLPAGIADDVLRREFTFNTLLWRLGGLVYGPAHAEILDLTGRGLADLRAGVIDTPLDPDKTFSDDPTRMLRAIKFILRYGFSVSDRVHTSILRNAHRIHDMPWEAVGKILVDDILMHSLAGSALPAMDDLGLTPEVVRMLTLKPFAAYVTRQLRQRFDVGLFLPLHDRGFGAVTPLQFLTTPQLPLFRHHVQSMAPEAAWNYLEALRAPPVDNMALIAEFDLAPRDRGRIAAAAREVLLQDPLLDNLTKRVRQALR